MVPDEEACADDPAPQTHFYRDRSQSLIGTNESPDVPFDASINPCRGCEHGCIYCYARPMHEYLGFSAGLFEAGLEHNFPMRKDKVLSQPHAARGGELNDSDFRTRTARRRAVC